MARLWSSGFELGSSATGVEWDSTVGTVSVNSTAAYIRSGDYSGRSNPTSSTGYFVKDVDDGVSYNEFHFRFYVYIATAPSAQAIIFTMRYSTGNTAQIRMNTDRTLELWGYSSSMIQRGSDSDALDTGKWYMVEMRYDYSGNNVYAKLDGTQFATGSLSANEGIQEIRLGIQTTTTADLYFDDVAVNDDAGSFQTGYPGSGNIVHLHPNADSTPDQWTPDSGNSYEMVDEVPPNDATDKIRSDTDGYETWVHLESMDDADAGKVDSVTLVHVGFRGRTEDTSFSDMDIGIYYSTAGEWYGVFNLGSTAWATWQSGTGAFPGYLLTTYNLPGASTTAWTETTIDGTEIGVYHEEAFSRWHDITSMWLLVEYIEDPATIQTVTAKANIINIAKTTLSSPADESSGESTVYFEWYLPQARSSIHSHIQVDGTSTAFGDIEIEKKSWIDTGFQYWDGDSWETYPATGVPRTYAGNKARIELTISGSGEKHWRVRGFIG